jgi:hypothetical protein
VGGVNGIDHVWDLLPRGTATALGKLEGSPPAE